MKKKPFPGSALLCFSLALKQPNLSLTHTHAHTLILFHTNGIKRIKKNSFSNGFKRHFASHEDDAIPMLFIRGCCYTQSKRLYIPTISICRYLLQVICIQQQWLCTDEFHFHVQQIAIIAIYRQVSYTENFRAHIAPSFSYIANILYAQTRIPIDKSFFLCLSLPCEKKCFFSFLELFFMKICNTIVSNETNMCGFVFICIHILMTMATEST